VKPADPPGMAGTLPQILPRGIIRDQEVHVATDETEKSGGARPLQRTERLGPAGGGLGGAVGILPAAPERTPEPAEEGEIEGTFRHSYSRDQATLIRRLRRIEGQVRGIERMIERREYCVDILQQTSALRAAIDSVALLILEDHVQGCVKTAAEQGDADQYIEEVLDVVRRALGKPVRPRV